MNVAATFSQMTSILSAVGQFLLILNLPLILLSGHHFPWVGILVLMVAPTLAMMLHLALSRTREFDADLGAAALTGDPQGLASALLKIERYQKGWMGRLRWLGRSGPYDSILNTHPATRDRVNRLIALGQNTPLDRSIPAKRKAYEKTLVNVRVRKAPDIGPTIKPEPLIPEKEPVHMGDISPVRSFETFSPSFEAAISVAFSPGLMKDHSVVIPLDRFGIRNLHCTVLFRPRDMD